MADENETLMRFIAAISTVQVHSFFRAVRSRSLRLSALMDLDLALVNGKSGR